MSVTPDDMWFAFHWPFGRQIAVSQDKEDFNCVNVDSEERFRDVMFDRWKSLIVGQVFFFAEEIAIRFTMKCAINSNCTGSIVQVQTMDRKYWNTEIEVHTTTVLLKI